MEFTNTKFTVELTRPQILRLMHLILGEMKNYGYDGEVVDFTNCAEILEALEQARE